jgi:hypothetical protein
LIKNFTQKSSLPGAISMLGIPDPGIYLAVLLCVLSAIICVVYGAMNWNSDDEPDPAEKQWAVEEKKLEEEL